MGLTALLAAAAVVAGGTPATSRSFEPSSLGFWDLHEGLVAGHELRANGRFGRAAVWATRDGGRTWRVVRRGLGPFEVATLRGGQGGWIATPWAFLGTSDRGRSWSLVARVGITRPSFATPSIGWALGRGSLLATRDGGRTWRRIRQPCGSLVRYFGAGISLTTPTRGWILCLGGAGTGMQLKRVHETADGGRTWMLRARAEARRPIVGNLTTSGYGGQISFLANGHGWLPLARGPFLETRDGGRRWRALPISRPEEVEAHAAQLLDDCRGLALVFYNPRLGVTNDGGRTWRYPHRFR